MDSIQHWENLLEEIMATYSNIIAWRIPWTEEPGGLQCMGSNFFKVERGQSEITKFRDQDYHSSQI